MNEAVAALEKLPVSSRLLKDTHKVLLQAVVSIRIPASFVTVKIGLAAHLCNDAVFVPPHYEDVLDLMADLERFLNDETFPVPHLIRIAIAHYQFETIHPFSDGNGRIGRLLITLYLVSKGLLIKPTLYLSDFFE